MTITEKARQFAKELRNKPTQAEKVVYGVEVCTQASVEVSQILLFDLRVEFAEDFIEQCMGYLFVHVIAVYILAKRHLSTN